MGTHAQPPTRSPSPRHAHRAGDIAGAHSADRAEDMYVELILAALLERLIDRKRKAASLPAEPRQRQLAQKADQADGAKAKPTSGADDSSFMIAK